MVDLTTKHDKFARVNQCIREAAREAAEHGLSASVVERFLRTGDRTWDGAGSGLFSSGQFKEDEVYSRAVKTTAGPVLSSGRTASRRSPFEGQGGLGRDSAPS